MTHETDCIEWHGVRNRDGYGNRSYKGRTWLSHRAAYDEVYGDPGKLCVLHRCDNPACVNIDHLFLGTQRDNVYDCMAKGRRRKQDGELSSAAKVTAAQVREIRRLHAAGGRTYAELGRRFGLTYVAVAAIVKRRTWASVT